MDASEKSDLVVNLGGKFRYTDCFSTRHTRSKMIDSHMFGFSLSMMNLMPSIW